MASNLPPGCSSDDGGIDHAFEMALEDVCEKIPNPAFAASLSLAMEGLWKLYEAGFGDGYEQGRQDAESKRRAGTPPVMM